MDLNAVTVTEIANVVTVYSERGGCDLMQNRACYGLSFCTEGRITYVQNGQEYVSDKGCAVLLPKGGSYRIQRDRTGYFPVINFDCLEFLSDTVVLLPIQSSARLMADYERMKHLFLLSGSRAQVFSIFYGMLHALCADDVPQALQGAVRRIKSDFADASLKNASLAAECNISEVYFRRLFTKHFGVSPKQFVMDVRLQNAKQLLAEGALSIAGISERCGFSSPYHFCRIFKERVGLTPSEYRKENLIFTI